MGNMTKQYWSNLAPILGAIGNMELTSTDTLGYGVYLFATGSLSRLKILYKISYEIVIETNNDLI